LQGLKSYSNSAGMFQGDNLYCGIYGVILVSNGDQLWVQIIMGVLWRYNSDFGITVNNNYMCY